MNSLNNGPAPGKLRASKMLVVPTEYSARSVNCDWCERARVPRRAALVVPVPWDPGILISDYRGPEPLAWIALPINYIVLLHSTSPPSRGNRNSPNISPMRLNSLIPHAFRWLLINCCSNASRTASILLKRRRSKTSTHAVFYNAIRMSRIAQYDGNFN